MPQAACNSQYGTSLGNVGSAELPDYIGYPHYMTPIIPHVTKVTFLL